MSLMEFMREFPDDETCLRHIWRERFAPDGEHAQCPRCERERVFKQYETAQRRPAWFCQTCGYRIHPLVGTIFVGYKRHRRINHTAKVYVDGDTHTQTIEGFFGLFKTGVRGAHHSVSYKWLQGYLNEWAWRYNRRESETPMFRDLLKTATKV